MTPKIDFDLSGKKIFVCGHKGMVGRALMRRFQQEDCDVLTADRNELDLRDDRAVVNGLQNFDLTSSLPQQKLGYFGK